MIITIGRQFGSGGREIGEKVAQRLGYAFYDKEILTMAAENSGFSPSAMQHYDEKPSGSLIYSLYMTGAASSDNLPLNQQLAFAQFNVIRKVAQSDNCVIVGRCADYVLRERKDLLNVFIHAPLEYRAQRAREVYEKQAGNMEDFVKKKDKKRASFYNYFSQNKWGDARHYHLAISSEYGVDFAVSVIKHAAESFPGGAR